MQKKKSPTLVYVSSPFRGLHLLGPLFKGMRTRLNGNLKLQVFSDFIRDYPPTDPVHDDDTNVVARPLRPDEIIEKYKNGVDRIYMHEYMALASIDGVEFYGSVTQKTLFEHMKEAMIMFYPNVFPETCCTSVLEAFACGNMVVSSRLAALPETTAGLADLIDLRMDVSRPSVAEYIEEPIRHLDSRYVTEITDVTVRLIEEWDSESNEERRRKQYNYVRENCLWAQKAEWWVREIMRIPSKRAE